VGICPLKTFCSRTLRSPPPPPPYSAPHIHTHSAHTHQPPSTRTLSSPHHPAHPPSEPPSSGQLTPHYKVRRWCGPHNSTRLVREPISVGSGPVNWFLSRSLRSPPSPPYSAPRIYTHRSHPPASLYVYTLLPSPPCSPTQRPSIGWAADPTLQGGAVGAGRTHKPTRSVRVPIEDGIGPQSRGRTNG
jgi:hypothetical protein